MRSWWASKTEKGKKRLLVQATFEAIVDSDPAKACVLGYFRELVADGRADWDAPEGGTIRLRLNTGEIYLLGKTGITRIA
jgi:hypothetical protein